MFCPKVSIVTPSYNQGEFLEATIQSVLGQGYPNLEYIVIDGGSTDNSVDIIRKYARHITYWVSEKDGGQSDAINKGLLQTSGDILGWINSDDIYLPGTFRKVVSAFERHSDAVVVHGDRVMIDRAGRVIGWTSLPQFDPNRHGFSVCSETAFWRRQAMAQSGPLKASLRFAMDLEFFCRMYGYGKFVKIDSYLGCFRCYAANKSSTLQSVCLAESEREWTELFHNSNWRVKPLSNRLLHYSKLATHPRLLGIPFLKYRLWQAKQC